MKKRIISLCTVLLTVSTIFCGCVNVTVVEKDDSSKKTEIPTVPSASKETEVPTVPSASEKTEASTTPPISEETEKLYISSAQIIIIAQGSSSNVSSDQLNSAKGLGETYAAALQDNTIQNTIKDAFPDAEYSCNAQYVKNTSILSIEVTSKQKEHLQEICDMLTDEFCAKAPELVEEGSITRLTKASTPKEITEG